MLNSVQVGSTALSARMDPEDLISGEVYRTAGEIALKLPEHNLAKAEAAAQVAG